MHLDVVVDQLGQLVEIAVDALLEDALDEHLPQVHTRPADAAVGAGPDMLLEQREQLGPTSWVAVDTLQALQHSGDVVTGLRVELNVPDVDGPCCGCRLSTPLMRLLAASSG